MEGTPKILIADDYWPNIIMATKNLGKMGYKTIIAARNGQEAIDFAIGQRPDLAIFDTELSGMRGYDVLSEIRKRGGGEGMAVMAVSTSAGNEEYKRAWEAVGVDTFLDKDIYLHADELGEAVKEALAKYQK